MKVGVWNMPEVRPAVDNLTCTAHVLRMYPEQGLMTIAWYDPGVRVVDISGLAGISVGVDEGAGNVGIGMKELGYYYYDDADTWSVKTNRIEPDGSFYMYGNDLNRGLDVYRFDASAQSTAQTGTWFAPQEYLAHAQATGILGATAGQGPYSSTEGWRSRSAIPGGGSPSGAACPHECRGWVGPSRLAAQPLGQQSAACSLTLRTLSPGSASYRS